MNDPYTTLGISKTASADEIKKAYRKLAHQHHPDKKGGDSAKFKEINEAYQVLSDPSKKRQYDQHGFAGSGAYGGGQQGQGFGGFSAGGGQTGGFDFSDIFDLFGGGFSAGDAAPAGGQGSAFRGGHEPTKGEDIHFEVPLSKKDLGKEKIFEFESQISCNTCHATGVAPGSSLKDCPTCKGVGQVRQTARTPFGSFTQVGLCPECRGKRKIPEKKCSDCAGTGRRKGKRTIELHLPKELGDGYNIAFPKQGNAGLNGKPAGDLLISLRLK